MAPTLRSQTLSFGPLRSSFDPACLFFELALGAGGAPSALIQASLEKGAQISQFELTHKKSCHGQMLVSNLLCEGTICAVSGHIAGNDEI
jgi:hypothetical protein